MHDYHAVQAVVDRLTAAGLGAVTEVRIQAGAAYSPVALRQAYEMLTLGTALAGSRLLVEQADQECSCPACGAAWRVTCDDLIGHTVVCPSCGVPASVEGATSLQVIGITGGW
jgi:Zn finger protein HypA/HybF involved in hydrogenase expression